MLPIYLAYLDNDNDKLLFEEMFYSYRKQMFVLALSILENSNDAEDAVSDVFLRIAQRNWDVVSKIETKTDLRNYLLKATKNTSLNMIKSKHRENASIDNVNEYESSIVKDFSDDEFLDIVCQKMQYREVVNAIKGLNEKYRDVLYYHFVIGLSVEETAKLLNQTVPTTKKQLVRGKKMLLGSIEERGIEEIVNK